MSTNWQVLDVGVIPWFGDPNSPPENLGERSEEGGRAKNDRKVKIIVIDDESVIAETVAEILVHEGFEATAVSTGISAIELARTWSPDIVLSDVVMPGMNGVETGIKIREIDPRCKIILFSGQAATVDLLEKAREQGHRFDIIAKPIRPEQLVSIIRTASGQLS